jgi:hypothetical protein
MAANFRDKRTSITKMRAKKLAFAIFPTFFHISHYLQLCLTSGAYPHLGNLVVKASPRHIGGEVHAVKQRLHVAVGRVQSRQHVLHLTDDIIF